MAETSNPVPPGEGGFTVAATFAQTLAQAMVAPLELLGSVMGQMMPGITAAAGQGDGEAAAGAMAAADAAHWAGVAMQMQGMWLDFQAEQAMKLATTPAHPAEWIARMGQFVKALPGALPDAQARAWEDATALWQGLAAQVVKAQSENPLEVLTAAAPAEADKRFAGAQWQDQPAFAMLSSAYLAISSRIEAIAEGIEGVDPARREQMLFAVKLLTEALSPANFPMTNPLVIERALQTRGQSLIRGLANLIADLRRGQLTHSDPNAFEIGRDIAVTPGKVVHETPLYQLIQYTPVTPQVLASPLVIFPPWINRFYILDLNAKKSFVKWAVEQGISVFMVSWKSADASMADVVWDDYVAAQIDAIDVARTRCNAEAAHAIGYCVAGTTLAATLAVMARSGVADRVKSATFFTAQVDFEDAGDLKHFVDDQQIAAVRRMSPDGYLDGRYMAATFNLLRGQDLIWNYVVGNYLLGEDHRPFDLLHWNGDTTNLPLKWHIAYLSDLYRDNRLVVPDELSVLDTPIDLRRIAVPCFIQAGREDHIAPATSVWKLTRLLAGDWTFVLAGSGHIAGVVNPPAAGKYQYWTNPDRGCESLADFVAGAQEHPGSWWPVWREWLGTIESESVPAKGKRVPGGRGDKVIEDAPGRYVRMN